MRQTSTGLDIQYEPSRVIPLTGNMCCCDKHLCDVIVAVCLPDSDPGSSTYEGSVVKLVGAGGGEGITGN